MTRAAGGQEPAVRTTCPYCGVGCGLLATPDAGGGVSVKGDPEHPANAGRLCSKGSALGETVGLEGRLLHPESGGRRVSWGRALDEVAGRFAAAIEEHGPDAVAFYVSGQFLTEDYYVANKLMKGFIGSANIDTNSRLCMASSVAGHKRAFGADTVPGCYEDLELADLVVMVGSNLAWCHPVLFQRIEAARRKRPEMKLVVIDPRRTVTADAADLHLPLAPDSDVALFNGLLAALEAEGRLDWPFISDHTRGFEETLAAARETAFDGALAASGLPAETLRRFYTLFAASEKSVTLYSQGVNQSTSGSDKVNAILNCHLATGRIGRPGAGPFSVTGQPNAMGGREVGGLANQLAAHMELENPVHRDLVGRFWQAPSLPARPGLKAVDLFQAVAEGRIKALWIAGTNPVDSLPDADAVRAALLLCPFVVVADVVRDNDTTALADVLLPALAWGEKDGTVTNSERVISRQRGFLPPPGEARPDWWMFCELASRLGHGEAFDYDGPADIFREHAALSGFENGGRRDFDIGGLADLSDADYRALSPLRWPMTTIGGTRERFFGQGGFYTRDGRARFIPLRPGPTGSRLSEDFPLVLNSGRVRDHWHTMTRTALSPRLSQHMAEPFVEIHPEDALERGLVGAALAWVQSSRGRVLVRVLVTARQRRGSLFLPLHWSDQNATQARADVLFAPACDPQSGQPALKFTAATVRPFAAAWYGFAVLRDDPGNLGLDYVVRARAPGGWRVEMADGSPADDCDAFARGLFGSEQGDGRSLEIVAYYEGIGGSRRYAAFQDDRLLGLLYLAAEPVAVSRAWATAQLGCERIEAGQRLRLLAGRSGSERPDPGAIVCSCFTVGADDIGRAALDGCASLEAVGQRLGAGSNCGSCRLEIQRILDHAQLQTAV